MIICLDVGNTHVFGGVMDGDEDLLTFRTNTTRGATSDEFGLFLRNVLKENGVDPERIERIAIGSVVPSVDYSLRAACVKYFKVTPFFLKAGVKTGLKIKYSNPLEVGADNIANAIAAVEMFPRTDLIIADYGTATVFCPVTAEKEFLGGSILPGMRLSMESLASNTAKLSSVEIVKPEASYGRTTKESIQTGLYYAQLGALKEFIKRVSEKEFKGKDVKVIGTGGFTHMFEEEGVFTEIVPDLTLRGLRRALEMNL